MDIIVLSLAFFFMIGGILGSILPVIPGTPISWIGLIILYLSPSLKFDWPFIIITGVIAIAIYILDYVVPAIGTKRFGGSKAGAWGAIIGLFVGIIVPIPLGILIGPFLGALVGELIINKTEKRQAWKAAFGSFIGFLASTFMKLVATFAFLLLFLYKVWDNWQLFEFKF